MKKTFILLMASLAAGYAHGQQASQGSMMLKPMATSAHGQALTTAEMDKRTASSPFRHQSARSAERTSVLSFTDWYDMWGQNYNTSFGPVSYYFASFPDSNVVDNSSTAYHIYCHGMGVSFDPTDSSYFSVDDDPYLQTAVSMNMTPGQVYTVDSFYAPVVYKRNDPSTTIVDTLVIEIALTQQSDATTTEDSGAYNLQYGTAATSFYPMAYDEMPRFGTVHYNSGRNRSLPYSAAPYINDTYFDSVFTTKVRFALPLTSTSVADTDINGQLDLHALMFGSAGTSVALPLNLVVNSGVQRPVSFISFKSGAAGGTYPLGTTIAAANWIKLFAGEPTGATTWWRQSSGNSTYAGSYEDGLIAQNQIRYTDTGYTYPHGVHDVLIPSYAFADVTGFDVPLQSWHIGWTQSPLAVTNVNHNVTSVKAYPNPASDMLSIAFSLASATPVTVTLTNMLGQVVATQHIASTATGSAVFNTSALAAGAYIYTVVANGERTTGHAAIAH